MSVLGPLLDSKLEVAVPLGVVFLSTAALLSYLKIDKVGVSHPLVGGEIGNFEKRRKHFFQHARELHTAGYNKFKDVVYRVTDTEGDMYVVPIRYLEELRKLPDSVLDLNPPIKDITMSKHVGFNIDNTFLAHIVRSDLTPNLAKFNENLALEVSQTVPEYLGTASDWKPIPVYNTVVKVVAVVSGHVFLGPKHNRDPVYLHSSVRFTIDLFKAADGIRAWPWWLRFLGKYQVPAMKTLNDHRVAARNFIGPMVQERRKKLEAGEEVEDDCLTWILKKAEKFNLTDDGIADTVLSLSLAAIHTTTGATTNVIYDIVAECPEVIPEVRKEIQEVLAEHDGVPTTQALYKMKLLDSIMRESQRMNPTGVSKFWRRTHQPLTLKDGTTFPAGANITAPHWSTYHDPNIYPDPYKFNPYRFVDIRNGKTDDPLNYQNKEQYQYVSVKPENIGFGYGKHACPGRFFAANEIKLILAQILMDYDMRLPDGVAGRYPNICTANMINPDQTKQVEFKYRGSKQ